MSDFEERLKARRAELEAQRQSGARPGPTIEAALAARRAELENMSGREVILEQGDGTFYRDASGALGYTSPGYSTTDRDKIIAMMQGALPADLMQGEIDRERIAANPIAARANEVVRGTPFVGSWTDEAVGLVSPGAAQNMRLASEAMQREKPGQTAALNVAGGIIGSVPLAVAAAPAVAARAPASIAGRVAAGAGTGIAAGTTEGAIWGAGEGQGAAERLRNTGRQAAIGGIFGGVMGAALPLTAGGIEALVKRYRGADVARIASEFGISKPAARMLKTAFEANDQDAVARIMRAGPDATLADAGVSGQALLDAAAQTGGRPLRIVRDAVETRATGALDVVNNALDTSLGQVRGPIAAARDVAASTAPARSSAYGAAYGTPINYADDTGRAIEDVLSRLDPGDVSSAVRIANRNMALNGEKNLQILFDVDTGRFVEMPNVRQLDEIKKALDGMASEGVDRFGRPTADGRYYRTASSQLRQAIIDATGGDTGAYAAALKVGQGKIQMDQGLELGLDMLRKTDITREAFREALDDLPDDAREMVKVGLRSYVDETLSRVKAIASDPNIDAREAREALGLLSSRGAKEKLGMLLGNDAGPLIRDINRAASAMEMRASVARNSATGIRQSIQGAGREAMEPGAIGTLARGEPVEATRRLTQLLLNTTPQADAGRAEAMWSEIASVLSDRRGSQGAKKAMEYIEGALAGQPLTERQAKLIANQVVLSLAPSAGRAATPFLAQP